VVQLETLEKASRRNSEPEPRTSEPSPALSVTLIGKSNGVGLARDLRLLSEALRQCGCNVKVHAADRGDGRQRRSILIQAFALAAAWLRRRRASRRGPPRSINVMLEHIWPQFLHRAQLNIVVPNPEWFDRRDQRLLASVNGVWTKTHHAKQVFTALGCRTAFIGFDSEDRYDPNVPRERSFFHLAGKSRMKGTDRLLRLWLQHPEWPKLVLVYHDEASQVVPQGALTASNIEWYRDYLPDEQLKRLQNASRFHLCLSEAEGWGHYIVEAMSVEAVTITLDAAPMNELVQPDRGLLVPGQISGTQNLCDTFGFNSSPLEKAVSEALALDDAQLRRLGQAARQWFLNNRSGFPSRLELALGSLSAAR
jgi:hypothetical protein